MSTRKGSLSERIIKALTPTSDENDNNINIQFKLLAMNENNQSDSDINSSEDEQKFIQLTNSDKNQNTQTNLLKNGSKLQISSNDNIQIVKPNQSSIEEFDEVKAAKDMVERVSDEKFSYNKAMKKIIREIQKVYCLLIFFMIAVTVAGYLIVGKMSPLMNYMDDFHNLAFEPEKLNGKYKSSPLLELTNVIKKVDEDLRSLGKSQQIIHNVKNNLTAFFDNVMNNTANYYHEFDEKWQDVFARRQSEEAERILEEEDALAKSEYCWKTTIDLSNKDKFNVTELVHALMVLSKKNESIPLNQSTIYSAIKYFSTRTTSQITGDLAKQIGWSLWAAYTYIPGKIASKTAALWNRLAKGGNTNEDNDHNYKQVLTNFVFNLLEELYPIIQTDVENPYAKKPTYSNGGRSKFSMDRIQTIIHKLPKLGTVALQQKALINSLIPLLEYKFKYLKCGDYNLLKKIDAHIESSQIYKNNNLYYLYQYDTDHKNNELNGLILNTKLSNKDPTNSENNAVLANDNRIVIQISGSTDTVIKQHYLENSQDIINMQKIGNNVLTIEPVDQVNILFDGHIYNLTIVLSNDKRIVIPIKLIADDSDDVLQAQYKSRNRLFHHLRDGYVWMYSLKFVYQIGEIGGLLPKAAQILSMRPDLIPDSILRKALEITQDGCKKRDLHRVQQVITAQNFNPPLPYLYNDSTLGVGSVGQVHLVWNATNINDKYVMKVNFPEVKSQFEEQWKLMGAIADTQISILWSNLWNFIRQQQEMIFRELNFTIEAQNTIKAKNILENDQTIIDVQEAMIDLGLRDDFLLSHVVDIENEFTTPNVLIQNMALGMPLKKYLAQENISNKYKEQALRNVIVWLGYQLFHIGFLHSDCHPGNIFVQYSSNDATFKPLSLYWIDWGQVEDKFYATKKSRDFMNNLKLLYQQLHNLYSKQSHELQKNINSFMKSLKAHLKQQDQLNGAQNMLGHILYNAGNSLHVNLETSQLKIIADYMRKLGFKMTKNRDRTLGKIGIGFFAADERLCNAEESLAMMEDDELEVLPVQSIFILRTLAIIAGFTQNNRYAEIDVVTLWKPFYDDPNYIPNTLFDKI